MVDETKQKNAAAQSFDEHASAYFRSRIHREGDDLDQLASWCRNATAILDVATGAGHTAGAVREGHPATIVATDAAPAMVRKTTDKVNGVTGVVGDAERLPFQRSSFDAVTCRIAAHHFPKPEMFLGEVARVLEQSGTFAFEDNIAPENDALAGFLNTVERLRDPTHVKSHTESWWLERLREAGFTVEETLVVTKTIDYRDWVAQLDTPVGNRERLEELFSDPPDGAIELFEISRDSQGVKSFANLKLLVRATVS